MKKMILFLIILALPVAAREIWLGVVCGMAGDSLLLVDGLKIHVPGLSAGKFVNESNAGIDVAAITFPFKASLVIDDRSAAVVDIHTDSGVKPEYEDLVWVKIHNFCEVIEGRLVDK